jgi:uncharacterized protein (DUF58 family)
MKELLKKLRKYEIQIRKVIKNQMQGDFHSVFKGSGLEFDDVRAYQYGDDIRSIDWNVSAKGHGTFVKTFKEDKEQEVFFVVDVSGSQEIGAEGRKKIDYARELCGVLALSAAHEGSKTGLLCFSDQKELIVKSKKGNAHIHELIHRLFKLAPKSRRTDLNAAILYALNLLKKRSVVFLISDFIDQDVSHNLRGLARKHDLIVIHIQDQREQNIPSLGIIPVYDKESQRLIWVNSSSSYFKERYSNKFNQNEDFLKEICKRNQADYLKITTGQDYVAELIKLFKVRNKIRKAG